MENLSVPAHVPPELVRNFNIFEFEGSSRDVHLAWHKVIEEEPGIFYTPVFGGYWVINDAALQEQAWPDADLFSSGLGGVGIPPTPKELPPMLPIDSDDPFHKALRRPLNVALSPKAVKDMTGRVRELARRLVAELLPRGNCDFVQDFSLKLPMEIFLSIVDLPSKDREYLISLAFDSIKNPDIDRRFAATREMFGYLDGWVRQRSEKPGDDLMSTVINMDIDGRSLAHEERLGYMAVLMFGGLDTVGGAMALITKHLAENPENRQRLVQDHTLIPQAIEELLRRFAISSLARSLTRDAEFGGVAMKRGERIMLPTMVHGLDARRWDDPLKVDFDRPAQGHIAFGAGTHRCPGAILARAEIRIFLEEWLDKIPEFSIAPQQEVRYQSGSVAGLLNLPLVWPNV